MKRKSEFVNQALVCYVLSIVLFVCIVMYVNRINAEDEQVMPSIVETAAEIVEPTESTWKPEYEIVATEIEHIDDGLEDDMDLLAKLVWGEARGSDAEQQAAVVWCVLNRCEDDRFPATIREVVKQNQPCVQFDGYDDSNPIVEEIRDVCVEIWNSWNMEQRGEQAVRELPLKFVYFHAERINGGWTNVYTTSWNGGERYVFE